MDKQLSILGATGSVGTQALQLLESDKQYELIALTANENVEQLIAQCQKHRPKFAAIGNQKKHKQLKEEVAHLGIKTAGGKEGLLEAASQNSSRILSAIAGFDGLAPSLTAIKHCKAILLANKESLVSAGALFMATAKKYHSKILPVDSEHNSLFRLLENLDKTDIYEVFLTASGGPFHHHSLEDLEHVTPAQATKHPIWSMGRKISVDSATLMNKGLELIEAHILFNLPADKLNILVHPQSIIHAILTLQDGSMVAHLATPSMLIPLHHTLYWQERKPNSYWQERKPNSPQGESFLSPRSPTSPTSPTSPIMSPMMSPIVSPMMPPIVSPMMSPNIKAVKPLSLNELKSLDFMSPDEDKFPCLRLAKEALSAGGIMPLWLNAANEVLVDAFLEGKIGFSSIASLLETSLAKCPSVSVKNLKNKSPADKRANDSTDFPINLKTNLRKNKFGTKSLETNQAERKNPEINQARAESPETIQARAESLEANQAERRGLETNQVRARNSEINLATEPILTLEEVNAFDEESRHITKALIEASQNK